MIDVMMANHSGVEVQKNWESDSDFKNLAPEKKKEATTAKLTDIVANSVGLSALRAQGLIPK